jgi:putative ABC transport system permease protein
MLWRKLLRDCWHLRGQLVSIAAVMACGIGAVVGLGTLVICLREARDGYYDRAHFPQVFASVRRAPEALAPRLAAIPGVMLVQTRVAARSLLQVPGLADVATGYILSLPGDGPTAMGMLHLLHGRLPAAGSGGEAVVGVHFAEANHLQPGDTLGAIVEGRWRRLVITGMAISPEFIHDAIPGAPPFGDSRHFGVLWMPRQPLAAMYDMEGAFNDVTLALAPGASTAPVLAALDALLVPYGGGHAYARKDQPSNVIVEGEIAQMRAFARVMPAIFLFVSAFLLNVVLSRLIDTERESLAVLKALGYDDRAIGWHYLGFVGAVVVLGTAMGIPFGNWLGARFVDLYAKFFRFPDFTFRTSVPLILLSTLVSAGSATVGALSAIRRAVRLPPAEGMRPPEPPMLRQLLLERLGLASQVPAAVRMVLRNLERTPFRSVTGIVGIALSAGVLLAGIFAFDSAEYLGWIQFEQVYRHDGEVLFTHARPLRVRHELARLPGVKGAELFRMTGARVLAGTRYRDIALVGLEPGAQLRRLVDADGRAHPIPSGGVVLTSALARVIGVRRGDTVTLEIYERGVDARVPVVALVDELFGNSAYMALPALARLMREPQAVTGAYLAWDAGAERAVLARLARMPYVGAATTREAGHAAFDKQITESMNTTTATITIVACIIALGVIYNGARIALSERGRELASLRVLGFRKGEVAQLLFGEQGALLLVGVPAGLLIGLGLAHLIAWAFQSELFRFPVIIRAGTYLFTVGAVAVAGVLAGAAIAGRLSRLDLIAVLKTRE